MEALQQITVMLAQLQSDVNEIKSQMRATQWVTGKDLAQLLRWPPRRPEVWRNRGLFNLDEGLIRNVGTALAPRWEYNLERCREQWEWWSGLTDDAKKAFKANQKTAHTGAK
jgi:hypothetical protein